MCLGQPSIRGVRDWNWEGDEIEHDTVVPSMRPAVGSSKMYEVDVREFLITERNAVMSRTLSRDLPKFLAGHGDGDPEFFTSRRSGSFDYRARVLAAFVSHRIEYVGNDRRDPWQFPDETLALGIGDCEDRALLLASLMLASGVSGYNVRVVLGEVRRGNRSYDHMWVMYKNEGGRWQLLEPLVVHTGKVTSDQKGTRGRPAPPVSYVPHFLFNDAHLWRVRRPQDVDGKERLIERHPWERDWVRFNPKFAGDVHRSILNDALYNHLTMIWRRDILDWLNSHYFSLAITGDTVDKVDTGTYHPYDHFDNGYIDGGWERLQQNLAAFSAAPRNLDAFAHAAHGIADFYAHSTYMNWAPPLDPDPVDGYAEPYDHATMAVDAARDYTGGALNLLSPRYTVNTKYFRSRNKDKAKIQAVLQKRWQGKVLSGRYAQPGGGILGWATGDIGPGGIKQQAPELICTLPADLKNAADFPDRGALPHHNEIAVDEFPKDMKASDFKVHKLYGKTEYATQFHRRYNTACRHILKEFISRWTF